MTETFKTNRGENPSLVNKIFSQNQLNDQLREKNHSKLP